MNRRNFAKSLIAVAAGIGVAKVATTVPAWEPLIVVGVDPAWDASTFTMTLGKWTDGTFEIIKYETWGTVVDEEGLRKISENFKANIADCWEEV